MTTQTQTTDLIHAITTDHRNVERAFVIDTAAGMIDKIRDALSEREV